MEARVVGSITLEPVDDYRWRIPRDQHPGMGAEGVVYLSDAMVQSSLTEPELKQVANVACLPGLQGPSMAMPDIHFGYGFPIGGVAATDADLPAQTLSYAIV